MLSSNQKGAIAEYEITAAAIRLDVHVFRPVAEGRYDLVFDVGAQLVRVQCKTARLMGDTVRIGCYSARRSAQGFVKRVYTSDEVDAIAAYAFELDRCFLVPISRVGGRSGISLRLREPRNNQQTGINWADTYELGATLSRLKGP